MWHAIALVKLRNSLEPPLEKAGDHALETFLRAWWDLVPQATYTEYISVLQERDTICHEWWLFMERFPVVILPSCPKGRMNADADAAGRDGVLDVLEGLRFQFPIPVLDLPSLAVPIGVYDGIPQGIQIVSRRYREDISFLVGRDIEVAEPQPTRIDPRF